MMLNNSAGPSYLCLVLMQMNFIWSRQMTEMVWLPADYDKCRLKSTFWIMLTRMNSARTIRGGADKSLARPGRKQATVIKLGIYSTNSPRSSIHFLAHWSNFCKPLKKNSEGCLSNQVSVAAMTSASKNGDLSIVVSVQGTGGSPTRPDPENRVGDQDTGSPSRPVSSGLQVPSELGHCHARTRPPCWPSHGIFPSKCPSIAPAEMSNTPRW